MTALLPQRPPAGSFEQRVAERLAAIDRTLRAIEAQVSGGTVAQFPVVTALLPAGRKGRAVVLAGDGKLYVDNGVAWIAQT